MNTVRCSVAALALAMMLAPAALAQSADYQPPRAADGKPDLQGFWSNVSLTSLERSGQFKTLVIPPEEATRIEQMRAAANVRAGEPTDPPMLFPAEATIVTPCKSAGRFIYPPLILSLY